MNRNRPLQVETEAPQAPAEEILFQEDRSRYTDFHGIVTDVIREERHYSGGYKFLRSLLYGEPYQLSKVGANRYGVTASFITLRLEPLDSEGAARDIVCYGEPRGRVGCGDEVSLHTRRRRNGYAFLSGWNYSIDAPLRKDFYLLNVHALLLVPILILALAALCLRSILQGLSALFSLLWVLMPFLLILLLPRLLRRRSRRRNSRWMNWR